MIFDNVEIPSGRLFIAPQFAAYSNTALNASWWANIMQQTMSRADQARIWLWPGAADGRVINDVSPRTNQMLRNCDGDSRYSRQVLRASTFYCDVKNGSIL